MLVSRFVDHMPQYRQEDIKVRTPRLTLASWSGHGGAGLQPLFDVHREFILGADVLHADKTPVRLLGPGAGKTKRAYARAYARSVLDPLPSIAYKFCLAVVASTPWKSGATGRAR